MLITRKREKLLNAIIFFATRTRHCGKTKLYKLLYLMDFEHFRQTGKSVTGLPYAAWKEGPVPFQLHKQLEKRPVDIREAVDIVPVKLRDRTRMQVVALQPFESDYFTPRELQLMERIAQRHRDDYAEDMVKLTHKEFGPWHRVWDEGRGRSAQIPYEYGISKDDPHRDDILEAAREYEGIVRRLGAR